MAIITTFANQKGGTGKTQCTVLAATALASLDYKVLVLDADDQQSITTARKFDEPTPQSFDIESPEDIYSTLEQRDNEYHVIFIDMPGRLDINLPVKDQRIIKALMYVDFLFIPFVAGNYNLESTLNFINAVKRVEAIRADDDRKLNVYGFINMYQRRSRLGDYLKQDIAEVHKISGLEFMRTPLKRLTAFSESNTVETLYKASRNNASVNLTQWIDELKSIIL